MLAEKELFNLFQKLEREFYSASKSKQQKLIYDAAFYEELRSINGTDKYELHNLKSHIKYNYFANLIIENREAFEKMADRVIDIFKDMNFYCYLRRSYKNIKKEEKEDILKNFLNSFIPELFDIYKDLVKYGRIFLASLKGAWGETFLFPSIDRYYIAITEDQINDIFDLETLVHELLHIYADVFAHNYNWHLNLNFMEGFYYETPSLYGELSLFEYMKKNNIYPEEMRKHRNIIDYFLLSYFKTIKYICVKLDSPDVTINLEDLNYKINGNALLDIDAGVPFFQYHEDIMKIGSLQDFIYGVSSFESYKLLERERKGEDIKKSINDFILSLDDDTKLYSFLSNPQMSEFMKSELESHNNYLKKKYPIPGYSVRSNV